MKAVINEKETPNEFEYPKLMKATGTGRIVLFFSDKTGVVVGPLDFGNYCTNWDSDLFTPFTGTITLSND